MVYFGERCRRFLDQRMRGLTLNHQFDEQWTFVFKKQSRLTFEERERRHAIGDVYLWTCIDQNTKLMPSFMVGKRSGDMARSFMLDVAGRLTWPNPQFGGGFRDVRRVLQLLLANQTARQVRQASADRCHDGRTGRACLVL
jgi:hypothetical protein